MSGLTLQKPTSRSGKRATCAAVQSFSARTRSRSSGRVGRNDEAKRYPRESTTPRRMPAASSSRTSESAWNGAANRGGVVRLPLSAAIRHAPSASFCSENSTLEVYRSDAPSPRAVFAATQTVEPCTAYALTTSRHPGRPLPMAAWIASRPWIERVNG